MIVSRPWTPGEAVVVQCSPASAEAPSHIDKKFRLMPHGFPMTANASLIFPSRVLFVCEIPQHTQWHFELFLNAYASRFVRRA
jgi:hypothetical protein